MATPTKRPAIELLNDPSVVAISIADACRILGIARSTAANAYTTTNQLCPGVDVLQIGRRRLVPTHQLRKALGLDEVRSA